MDSNGSRPPPIGLTTYDMSALLPMTYVSAVIRSGGSPVLLPPSPTEPGQAITSLDGLIVTGGPDVDPELYEAEPHPLTEEPRKERDAWEASLCREALEEDLPILAICRGLQVLNVALGGTLHQHLPDVVGHSQPRTAIGQMNPNVMSIESGSSLAAILGASAEGLCHHHQAVDRLGRRIRAVAFAPDGTIEGIEVSGQEFAIGVQWHPEDNSSDDRLFQALVRTASRYRDEVRP